MSNAYVTVNPDGNLTLGSMVTVEDESGTTLAFNEVPYLDGPYVSAMFWVLVECALKEVGWHFPHSVPQHVRDGDVVRFDAVQL